MESALSNKSGAWTKFAADAAQYCYDGLRYATPGEGK
jgi:hypothetical protein